MPIVLAAVLSAWMQLTGTGPSARVVATGACPPLVVDGVLTAMRARAGIDAAFPDLVCDAPVPFDARVVRVAERTLPAPTRGPLRTIAVLGDTGCRIKGTTAQACADPAAWPFPRIAAAIARERPDLVVHVGDYLYRETPCPAVATGCAGSPSGDRAEAWNADWLRPAAPIFASAPLVLVRGNHESCTRAGTGWSRYLAAQAAAACTPTEDPYAVRLDGLDLVVMDDADDDDRTARPETALRSARNLAAAGTLARGESWLLTHRPPYTTATLAANGLAPYRPYEALLSGHIHTFAALSVPGGPPLLIDGMGGDALDALDPLPIARALYGAPFTSTALDPSFGYAIYRRAGDGWTIDVHRPDGTLAHTCALRARGVACS